MRYFELKPEVELEMEAGQKVKIGFKKLFLETLITDNKESSEATTAENFLRLSSLYSKVKDLKDGDIIEIEDQDFKIIQLKLDFYVKNLKGFAIMLPIVSNYIEYTSNLPTTHPKNK